MGIVEKMKYLLMLILMFVFSNVYAFDKKDNITDEEYNLAKNTFYIQAEQLKNRDSIALQISSIMEKNIELLGKQRLEMEASLASLLIEKERLLRDSVMRNAEILQNEAELRALNNQIKENQEKLKQLKKDKNACTGYSFFDWILDPLFCKEIKEAFGYKNQFYENEINKYSREKSQKEALIGTSKQKIDETKKKLAQEMKSIQDLNYKQEINENQLVETSKKYAVIQDTVIDFNSKFLGFKFLSDNIDSAEYLNNPKALYPLFLNTSKSYSENIQKYDNFLNQYKTNQIQISTNF